MVIWRSWAMRLMAIPFFAIGVCGATMGKTYDVLIPPMPDAVAIRGEDGKLGILGKKANRFAAEQWLRADGDGRSTAKTAPPLSVGECDKLGCIGTLHDGRKVALIYDRAALAVDCQRANIIITTEYAPKYCGAELVVDRKNLEVAGAVGLKLIKERLVIETARSPTEDRPWSPYNMKAKASWPEIKKLQNEAKEEYSPFEDESEAPVLLD